MQIKVEYFKIGERYPDLIGTKISGAQDAVARQSRTRRMSRGSVVVLCAITSGVMKAMDVNIVNRSCAQ
jgi:hypothetical protein